MSPITSDAGSGVRHLHGTPGCGFRGSRARGDKSQHDATDGGSELRRDNHNHNFSLQDFSEVRSGCARRRYDRGAGASTDSRRRQTEPGRQGAVAAAAQHHQIGVSTLCRMQQLLGRMATQDLGPR